MEVDGSGFEIWNTHSSFNGTAQDELANQAIDARSDGMTILRCDADPMTHERSSIHSNVLEDNTDIDLIVGGGTGCDVYSNLITNTYHHGFAGLMVAYFPNAVGDHSGVVYTNNTVNSALDKLAFGVMVGHHPWNPLVWLPSAGSVSGNTSIGAVVNVAVDGIRDGAVRENGFANPRGSYGFNCNLPVDYSAFDVIEAGPPDAPAIIQGGWITRHYHPSGCGPQ